MAEARAKPITPIRSVRLGPIMSPMRPPNRSSPPKANVYAVTTHWRSTLENPRERCADGSAMIMMVVSRTTMSWAPAMMTSVHQWARVGPLDNGAALASAAAVTVSGRCARQPSAATRPVVPTGHRRDDESS